MKDKTLQFSTEEYEDKIKASLLRQIRKALEDLPECMVQYDIYLKEQGKSLRTRSVYLQDIRQFIHYLSDHGYTEQFKSRYIKPKAFEVITQTSISDFIDQHQESPSAVKRKLASLRSLSLWLTETNGKGLSEVSSLYTPKQKRISVPELTSHDAQQLINIIKKEYQLALLAKEDLAEKDGVNTKRILKRPHLLLRDLSLVSLITTTALRISEIVALNTDDILEHHSLRIWRKNKYVTIQIPSETMDHLQNYLVRKGAREFLSANSHNEKALFIGNTHARITTYSVQKMFRSYTNAVYGPDCNITAASFRLANGKNMDKTDQEAFAEIMGYASTAVIKQIYRKS